MGKLDFIYKYSPVWLQNLLVSTYGIYWKWLRFSGSYRSHLQTYHRRDRFSPEQWQRLSQAKLKELLFIAYHHVPHYQESWSQSAYSAAMNGELEALPLLEKDPLRENPHRFCRQDQKPIPKLIFHTSGTTGTPLQSIWTVSEMRNALALREARSAHWAGVSFSQPRATFSGRLVEPDPERNMHVYRYNAIEKQVYFSAFHLKPQTAHRYVEALIKHKTTWMTGYAVSFYLLAKFILDQNIPVPHLQAVITTSEKLTSNMRKVMESAFRCKVYEEYSTVENALFASECEHGCLHISPDAGFIEIIKPDGTPCEPGEIGEVVTTCLTRTYQPLIRFRLGDLAAWSSEPCPCGRHMPVIKEVVGRIEDVVIGPDGQQLVRFHGIFVDQPHIIEGQIIQETLRSFSVNVVTTDRFGEMDIIEIKKRMHQRLGEAVHIQVVQVDNIPRTTSGKFQAVISKVK